MTTPARVRDAAQHRDGELAAEDHRHHPRRRQVHLHQRHERGGDQQLVGERIHQLPEGRDLLAAPRQIAVEPVGQRRERRRSPRRPVPCRTPKISRLRTSSAARRRAAARGRSGRA